MPPAEHGSSPLAVLAAILLLIGGVLIILFGAGLLLVGSAGAGFILEMDPTLGSEADAVARIVTAVGLVFVVIGILQIAAAIGVFVHKSWARWLGVVLGSVGLVIGILILLATFVPPAGGTTEIAIALIWLGAHGFVVAALAAAGLHFQPKYAAR